ncbi:MAG: Trk system potassium transporter TrkA [Ruminococcus sp.]|nr:Trk system potassium transporter TrkA [Ruminococcus sp.]
MKVVIVGSGKVGGSIASSLSDEGHSVTIVDTKADALKRIQNTKDVMCIEGNGATLVVQKDAGVNKAGLLIAATPFDELNMLCCLLAKRLGCKQTIPRVRNPAYFGQIDTVREDLGVSMVINPEFTTAEEFARVLIFPTAAKVEVFEKGRIELVEHKLAEDSTLDGLSLAEIYKRTNIRFLICAVQRDSKIFIPTGDFILRSGDRINIVASHKDLERFFRMCGALKDKIKTVMIVGGGKICYYLSKQLLSMGMRVKIIERDYNRCTELAEILPKATVIHGDGTDQELLEEEGIQEADSFVAITGIDEENIIMSLYAKMNTNAKVVTKVNRDSYVDLASQIGLDTVISPKYIITSNVLSYVRSQGPAMDSNIESLYHLVSNRVEAIEFKVRENIPGVVGIKLMTMELKKDILICAIVRKRDIIIPSGNDTIEIGDSVVVVSKEHRISDLKDILE